MQELATLVFRAQTGLPAGWGGYRRILQAVRASPVREYSLTSEERRAKLR
jgi:hypothetical protein